MRFGHLAITVSDQARSRSFYQRWFGFLPETARTYPDGTLILRDGDGFALALHPGDGAPDDEFLHFGFSCADPGEVHDLRARLVSAGETVVEHDDEPDLVSVKVLDPDGYRVEIFWEV